MTRGPPVAGKYIPTADRRPMTPYPQSPGEFRYESEDQRAAPPPEPGQIGRFNFGCVRGGGNCGAIRIFNGPKPANSAKTWGWDGNVEKPTLHPSIDCQSHNPKTGEEYAGCGWHGWVKKGEFSDA